MMDNGQEKEGEGEEKDQKTEQLSRAWNRPLASIMGDRIKKERE